MTMQSLELYEGPMDAPYSAHVERPSVFPEAAETPFDFGALVSHPLAEVILGEDGQLNMTMYMKLVDDIRHRNPNVHPAISGVITHAITIVDRRQADTGRYISWGEFNGVVAACILAEQLFDVMPVLVG